MTAIMRGILHKGQVRKRDRGPQYKEEGSGEASLDETGPSKLSRMTAKARPVTMCQGSLAVAGIFPLMTWSRKLTLSL